MVVKDKEEGGGVWNEATDGTETRILSWVLVSGEMGDKGDPQHVDMARKEAGMWG